MSDQSSDLLVKYLFDFRANRGDLTKIKIIKAAIDVIAHHGPNALSFEAVAKKLKTTRSHIAYHFPEKDELLLGCVKYIIFTAQDQTVSLVEKAKRWQERIEAVIDGALNWAQKYEEQVPVLLGFFLQSISNSKLRDINTEIRLTGFERIAAILTSPGGPGIDENEAQPLARAIQGMITSALLEHFSTNTTKNLTEVRRHLKRHIFSLIQGSA